MRVERKTATRMAVLAVASLLTLMVCQQLLRRSWDIGIKDEWQWAYYERNPSWTLLALPLLLVAALGALAAYGMRREGAKRLLVAGLLCGIVLASFALHQTLPYASPLGPYEYLYVTVFPWVGGYYADALNVTSPAEYLAHYAKRIGSLEVNNKFWGHLADHPPGAVLVHWAINRAVSAWPGLAHRLWPDKPFENRVQASVEKLLGRPISQEQMAGAVASGWVWPLLACLTVIPVYLLGRWGHSQAAGMAAAGLCATIPALHVFGPYPDQVLPLLAMAALYFYWRAAHGGSIGWAAACGLALFLGLQFTLAIAAMLALMGAATVLILLRNRSGQVDAAHRGAGVSATRWAALAGMAGLAGFVLPALASKVFLDYDVVEVWRTCFSKHAAFARYFPRTYWKWALFGPVELALFMGVPLACLTAWRAARQGWKGLAPSLPAQRGLPDQRGLPAQAEKFDVLLWSFIAVVIVLDVSGKSLGEVGRLWMFLMPLGAVASAAEVSEWPSPTSAFGVLMALMSLQLFCFRILLNVFGIAGG